MTIFRYAVCRELGNIYSGRLSTRVRALIASRENKTVSVKCPTRCPPPLFFLLGEKGQEVPRYRQAPVSIEVGRFVNGGRGLCRRVTGACHARQCVMGSRRQRDVEARLLPTLAHTSCARSYSR